MSKRPNTTNDDLLAQLDDLSTQPQSKPRPSRPVTTRAPKSSQGATTHPQTEQDLLAELGNLAQRPSQPSSRPGTPALRTAPKSNAVTLSPSRASTATPPLGRPSEERVVGSSSDRKSGDSTRSSHQAFTPATTTADDSPNEADPTHNQSSRATRDPAPSASGGGGWGGWFTSIATTAVSQAQAQVKTLSQNAPTSLPSTADASKWTEQLRGGSSSLLSSYLNSETVNSLKSMALPTFQNILQTIAPPISSHERLMIYVTHSLLGYPSLERGIYEVFRRVMSQVEGGELLVVQRGEERSGRQSRGSSMERSRSSGAGWNDGPWWRADHPDQARNIHAVRGLADGTRKARLDAEHYAKEYFENHVRGGLEAAAKRATETLSDSNPTRDSQIFLAIQTVVVEIGDDLFASAQSAASSENEPMAQPMPEAREELVFAIYLHDPIHGISFSAVSQAVPWQWIEWLDAPNGVEGALPESLEEIIHSGGVDPREWVSEWLQETLQLAAGIVAQRYVARRMGVGEQSKGKGKLRAEIGQKEIVESGGGEMARAGLPGM